MIRTTICVTIVSSLFIFTFLYAQEYIWPTDASNAITSSFAESRPGRFHAGIDVKTWGQEGYDIYAIRRGFVSRIRVSPFGYGRAIYLSLDSGETVVYGHLKKFNDEIEEYVWERQKQRGTFQVDLYPASGRFRYEKGDLLGYTGQTGIGSPHLHFEIRDRNNRPFNPFLRGYKVHDTLAPVITRLSITPMDGLSTVNDDWQPVIIRPTPIASGEYTIQEPVYVHGRITFGASSYDQMDGISNKFGTYKNSLFIDGRQVFTARYDKYSYAQNHHANLDRNYRLRMLGKGLFYQFFRDKGNTLSFYDSTSFYYGMVHFMSRANEQLPTDVRELWPSALLTIGPGQHEFEMLLSDFWGNTSKVTGRLIAAQRAVLEMTNTKEDTGTRLLVKSDIPQSYCKLYVTAGQNTKMMRQPPDADRAGGLPDTRHFPFRIPLTGDNGLVSIKAVTGDRFGFESLPAFYLMGTHADDSANVSVSVQHEFFDHYIRFHIRFSDIVTVNKLEMWEKTGRPVPLSYVAEDIYRYRGVCSRFPQSDGPLYLDIRYTDRTGRERTHREILSFYAVLKNSSKRLRSPDARCFFDFSPQSMYKNSFITTGVDSTSPNGTKRTSHLYSIGPVTAPIYKGYNLSITIPPGDSLPDKLGIYYLYGKNRWIFQGNRYKPEAGLISAHVSDFGTFALVHDTTAPVVRYLNPVNHSRLNNKKPKLYVVFKDDLSGVVGENNMRLFLDGQKLIAEYDPDKRTLFYRMRDPLTAGRHLVKCVIRDRCGNVAERTHVFFVND